MLKHGNSIYFTHDKLIDFPKSGHNYLFIIKLLFWISLVSWVHRFTITFKLFTNDGLQMFLINVKSAYTAGCFELYRRLRISCVITTKLA